MDHHTTVVIFLLIGCISIIANGFKEFNYADYRNKQCPLQISKEGCFDIDRSTDRGPLLLNWRSDIEWSEDRIAHFGNSLVCGCADAAKHAKFSHFAIHFYGECYGLNIDPTVLNSMEDGNCLQTDGSYAIQCNDYNMGNNFACLGGDHYYAYTVEKPVDGGYGEWSDWSACSMTCGEGMTTRTRLCDNPAPDFGGKFCEGHEEEIESCIVTECPIDGGYSPWSGWTICSSECGGGFRSNHRECDNPTPTFGGAPCMEENMMTESCNTHVCPFYDVYGPWSEWTFCPVTCGGGHRERSQQCTDPDLCDGPRTEYDLCNTMPCPIDGGFTDWSDWTPCSTTCGEGYTSRNRSCTNPRPQYGGSICEGFEEEHLLCMLMKCPDGKWKYGKWSKCSKSCGGGVSTRTGKCPATAICPGTGIKTRACRTNECPKPCVFENGVTVIKKATKIQRAVMISKYRKINNEFTVRFEFKAVKFTKGRRNIMQVKTKTKHLYGRRIPLVFLNRKRIHVCVPFNKNAGKLQNCFTMKNQILANKWYKIVVSQKKDGKKYRMKVFITYNESRNGKVMTRKVVLLNKLHARVRVFNKVKVYASNVWMKPAAGFIKNLVIDGICRY